MKVAARIGERLRREIGRGRRPCKGGWATASTTLLPLKSRVPSSHPSLGFSIFFLSFSLGLYVFFLSLCCVFSFFLL